MNIFTQNVNVMLWKTETCIIRIKVKIFQTFALQTHAVVDLDGCTKPDITSIS